MSKPDAETEPWLRQLRSLMDRRRLGKELLRSSLVQRAGAALIGSVLQTTWRLNRDIPASTDHEALLEGEWPVIFALWHGQHLLVPYAAPKTREFVSLVSRSVDAEINARVIERAGHSVIRGSGGRDAGATARKGGVSALIAMRKALHAGTNVVMIADISKGEARQAGEGIVTLAKLSGRPIVPMALSTSRRYVIDRSWDKTTIGLPFGRRCLMLAPPIRVPADADAEALKLARDRVTAELNRVTSEVARALEVRP